MTQQNLPELPEPFMLLDHMPHLRAAWAEQMHAYALAALAQSGQGEAVAGKWDGAEEFEAAIPTDAGLALAAMIREGVTSLGSHIGYAMQALVKPIHDPAVTTPREVLVGESPVDRIAAPAQEHPHDTEDGSRRWVLVQSLKASKGWATEFAEAFIDEFLSTEAQQQAGVA